MPPRNALFWDGVAWGWRLALVMGHLCFMAFALIRQNAPLLFQSYSAFDDALPFVCWSAWSVLAAILLLALPPRVPFGLISTLFSSFLYYLMAGLFSVGGGLVFISLICYLFGSLGVLLFGRALWLYMVRVTWFRDRIMSRSPSHGR